MKTARANMINVTEDEVMANANYEDLYYAQEDMADATNNYNDSETTSQTYRSHGGLELYEDNHSEQQETNGNSTACSNHTAGAI